MLDPHGDLIEQVLERVPKEREGDVIVFDPSDEDYPLGFNVLSAHSNTEKNLLASDLVGVFRRLSTSWGDQMNSVLGNAILAFLESSQGGTLADLRRFLLEPAFRKEFLKTVQDPEIVYYWQRAFPILKSNSVGPLLTRLDTFLRPKAIRYVVGQRANKLDFGRILNKGKILLAKLPHGLIGEENAFLLGALLVAKFHQMALSRQEIDAKLRRPFYLYLDEFQNFATPSMASILSGVRKYQLGLVLAHHELRQLQHSEDLAGAVLSHPYTRVCFRLGDADARKLADGFSYFTAADLQNLGTGEAICRMERSDYDFNLSTVVPDVNDLEAAGQRMQRIVDASRARYGTPRAVVEEELARCRADSMQEGPDPFAKRTAAERPPSTKEDHKAPPPPVPEPVEEDSLAKPEPRAEESIKSPTKQSENLKPSTVPGEQRPQGKGGLEHLGYQQMLKQLAEQRGWKAAIEEGNADVVLCKGGIRVACEVIVTTRLKHNLEVIQKRLAAGFSKIAVVSADDKGASRLADATAKQLSKAECERITFLKPEEFSEYLQSVDTLDVSGQSLEKGQRVNTSYRTLSEAEGKKRRKRLAEIMARSRKRRKGDGS